MRKPSIHWLLAVGTLLLSATITPAQHQQITLTRIGPVVEVEDMDGGRPKFEAVNGNEVYENDLVVTSGSGSRVILVFSNGATINVGEESRVEVRQFYQDPFAGDFAFAEATSEPEGAISRTSIHLSEGELIGNVKSLNEGSTFEVTTPAGAAGIRGTTFRVVFRPQGDGQAFFSVTTVEGNILVTPYEGTTTTGGISVSDLEEVEILVEVDDSTGEVTSVTVVDGDGVKPADPEVVAVVTEVVQEAAEEVSTIVLTSDGDQQQGGEDQGDSSTDEGDDEEDNDGSNEEDNNDGENDGSNDGDNDGNNDGGNDGNNDGSNDGSNDGNNDGSNDGSGSDQGGNDSNDGSQNEPDPQPQNTPGQNPADPLSPIAGGN